MQPARLRSKPCLMALLRRPLRPHLPAIKGQISPRRKLTFRWFRQSTPGSEAATDKDASPDKPKAPVGSAKAAQAHLNPPPASNEDLRQAQIAMEQQKKLLDEMEIENDHLESREAAVESSLEAMESQMRQSGLGLRGDMVSARSSMRTDMAKAKQALDGSDTERAKIGRASCRVRGWIS